MAILLVTFRLQDPNKIYDNLFEEISEFPNIQISSTSYLIDSDDTPSQIYKRLRPFVSVPKDTLMVITMSSPWHGRGPNELIDWVIQRSD